ncbi:Centromere protein C-like protein, partial [Drosera capensis]
FPRTFGSSSLVVNNSDDDVDAIHFHLKALELRNPEKLLDQAKRVIDSVTASTGITTTDGDDAVSKIYKDKSEVVAAKGAENPRRRRPGLGRRRAQFSLLSNASECAENIKPSQNIDISEDPDEYFARLDRLEKAERELQRQRGIALMDLDQNAPLVNARRRGPSLLGRTVTYKHRFPTDWIDNENSSLPSEEALVQDVSKSPSDIMAPETADQDNSSQAATVEDQVSKVLDELLSRNEDELHEDFIMNLVQERFNMKPISLSKISLPDLPDVRRSLPESCRNASQLMLQAPSHEHDLVIARKSVDRNPEIDSAFSRSSPTARKSPLASMSSLKRRMSKFDPRKDSLSAFDVDPSHVRPMSSRQSDKQSYQIDMSDEEGNSEVHENVGIQVGCEESHDIHMEDVPDVTCNTSDASRIMDSDCDMIDGAINRSFGINDGVLVSIDQSSGSANQIHEATKIKSIRGRTMGKSPGHSSKTVHWKPETEAGEHEKQISKQPVDGQNLNAVEKTTEEPLRLQETDHQWSSDILNEAAPMQKQISNVSANEKVQINAARRKKKLIDLRKSLAGAGSKWESAVRRSSRIRTRPLEYWKGERLLYGRIHRTMPTVIGLKYLSPARNGGKAQVRVQSYVADEHKDLVERVARY